MPESFADHVAAAIADLERSGLRLSALLIDSIFSSDGVFADPQAFCGRRSSACALPAAC